MAHTRTFSFFLFLSFHSSRSSLLRSSFQVPLHSFYTVCFLFSPFFSFSITLFPISSQSEFHSPFRPLLSECSPNFFVFPSPSLSFQALAPSSFSLLQFTLSLLLFSFIDLSLQQTMQRLWSTPSEKDKSRKSPTNEREQTSNVLFLQVPSSHAPSLPSSFSSHHQSLPNHHGLSPRQ